MQTCDFEESTNKYLSHYSGIHQIELSFGILTDPNRKYLFWFNIRQQEKQWFEFFIWGLQTSGVICTTFKVYLVMREIF